MPEPETRLREGHALPRHPDGADPIGRRTGFTSLLERIEGNGVRTILVETADRFVRDLMARRSGT